MPHQKKPPLKKDQVRIIGGKWRSRKLTFSGESGIRPTPDRVRETLFNWLNPTIQDAYCLDLFSGSGALGFEALSRGARFVVMVDQSPQVVDQLKSNAQLLQISSDQLTIYQATIPKSEITFAPQPFDIIFLDPPFHQQLIPVCCHWLEEKRWVKSNTLLYIETEAELLHLSLPAHWQMLKSQQAGQVRYYLVRYCEPTR